MLRQVIASLVAVGLLALVGCGAGLTATTGTVTLDGTPVSGATVSFIPADETSGALATGVTDERGNFTLSTSGRSGAKTGNYKVVVTKMVPIAGAENLKPGTPEYTKFMQEQAKSMMPMGGGGPAGKGGKDKGKSGFDSPNDLPGIYSSAVTTPFSQTVPAGGPVTLALTSSSPKKK